MNTYVIMMIIAILFLGLLAGIAMCDEAGIVCDNGETVVLPENEDAQIDSWDKYCKPTTGNPTLLLRKTTSVQAKKTLAQAESTEKKTCADAYSYYVPELKTFLTMTVNEGQIIIKKTRAGQIPLSSCFEVRTNVNRKTLEGIVLTASETSIKIDDYTHTDGGKVRLIYKDIEIARYPTKAIPAAPRLQRKVAMTWASMKNR